MKLDSKSRILFPKKYVDKVVAEFGSPTFILHKGLDPGCMYIYTEKDWEDHIAPFKKIPLHERSKQDAFRKYIKSSEEVTADAANRISIPKKLVEAAQIVKEVVLFGHMGRCELWAKEFFDRKVPEVDQDGLLTLYMELTDRGGERSGLE